MITTAAQAADRLNALGYILQPASTPLPGVWYAIGVWNHGLFMPERAIVEGELFGWASEGFPGLPPRL